MLLDSLAASGQLPLAVVIAVDGCKSFGIGVVSGFVMGMVMRIVVNAFVIMFMIVDRVGFFVCGFFVLRFGQMFGQSSGFVIGHLRGGVFVESQVRLIF